MKTKLCLSKPLESKLRCVKSLKNITGLGLKEAKDITDILGERFSFNHMAEVEVEIINHDAGEINILKSQGVIFGDDREDVINELLLAYRVKVPSEKFEYKVFKGSYTIESNILVLNIEHGELENNNTDMYHSNRILNNVKITMDFNKANIEEYT